MTICANTNRFPGKQTKARSAIIITGEEDHQGTFYHIQFRTENWKVFELLLLSL